MVDIKDEVRKMLRTKSSSKLVAKFSVYVCTKENVQKYKQLRGSVVDLIWLRFLQKKVTK